MSNFDDTFEAVAAPVAEAEHGITVVFSRGGVLSDAFTATALDVDVEVTSEEGFRTQAQSRAFRLPVSAVAISGSPVEPRRGDRLTLTENSVEMVFEIMPMSDNVPAVSLLSGGYRWFVYTKRIS